MSVIPRPATLEDMVYQLWFAVIGSNGDGLASQVRATREEVEEIKGILPTLWTREDHECAEREYQAKDAEKEKERRENIDRRKMSAREKAMLVATFLGSFAGLGGVIVAIIALKGGGAQ